MHFEISFLTQILIMLLVMLLLHLNHQVLFTALKCTKNYSRFSFYIMSDNAKNLKDKLQSQFFSLRFVTYHVKIKKNSTALKCFYITICFNIEFIWWSCFKKWRKCWQLLFWQNHKFLSNMFTFRKFQSCDWWQVFFGYW